MSAQTSLEVFKHFSVLAGVSYAKRRTFRKSRRRRPGFRSPESTSYRGGLVYEFLPGANAYLSYSQSFNPQSLIDGNGNVLPPVKGEQYEGGVKFRPVGDRIILTAAVFQIKQKNQGEFSEQVAGLDRYEPVGELTHKGFELEGTGRIGQAWQLNAGYAYLDPEGNPLGFRPDGRRRDGTVLPRQTGSVFATYFREARARARSVHRGRGAIRSVGSHGHRPGRLKIFQVTHWLMPRSGIARRHGRFSSTLTTCSIAIAHQQLQYAVLR